MNKSTLTACVILALTNITVAHAAEPNVKRSQQGVCYEKSQRGYKDVGSYRPYDSLDECVEAGGRLPNTTGWNFLGLNKQASSDAQSANQAASAVQQDTATTPKPADNKLFDSKDNFVKKSRDGLCIEPSSQAFARITDFSAYRNLQDCLDSGGIAP